MKYVKMFGPAAMAAMALMAFGAGGASAASSLYSTGVQVSAGTWLDASMESGSSGLLSTTDEKTLVDTCTSSTVNGTVEYPGGSDVKASISSLTWGGCSVTTDTLTNGALSVSKTGTVTGTGSVVTVNFGGVSCRYGTGTGTDLGSLTTGKLAIKAVINEQEPKSFICPDTTKWTANYTVTSPHDLTAGEGEGGGGGGGSIDIEPGSKKFKFTEWQNFRIRNTGPGSATINNLTMSITKGTGSAFVLEDPNGCKGKTLSSGGTCEVQITCWEWEAHGSLTVDTNTGSKTATFNSTP